VAYRTWVTFKKTIKKLEILINNMLKLDYKIIFLLFNMIVYKSKINFYLKLTFIKIHVSY